jgi:hypothetical protein
MTVKELNAFAENKPGRLDRMISLLAKAKVNIRAITIASGDEYGVVKLLVDDPEGALKALSAGGVTASLKEVVAVEMKDVPGGLHAVLSFLTASGVNIEDAYGFVIESGDDAVFVMQVEAPQAAEKLLEANGFRLVGPSRLYNM